MASYPAVPLDRESNRTLVSGTVVDLAANGQVRARNFHAQPVFRFAMVHTFISEAQAQQLETFFVANTEAVIDLVWRDGVTYQVILDDAGWLIDRIQGPWWRANASLTGSAAP